MKFLLLLLSFVVSAFAQAGSVELNPKRTIEISGAIRGGMVFPVVRKLGEMEADKSLPVDIILESPGGSVAAGYLIIDRIQALRENGIKVRCFVRHLAASMAFQMLLHCDERYSTPHALLLWHPVRVFLEEPLTARDAAILHKHMADTDAYIIADLKRNLPLSEEQLLYHFHNETMHTAYTLDRIAPGFFKYVGDGVQGLYSGQRPVPAAQEAQDTTKKNRYSNIQKSIMYLHETFLRGGYFRE